MASEYVLYNKWKGSQVFMYAKNVEKDVLYVPNPKCFGNLLTPKYVLTTVTCFIDEKGWEKISNVLLNLNEIILHLVLFCF